VAKSSDFLPDVAGTIRISFDEDDILVARGADVRDSVYSIRHVKYARVFSFSISDVNTEGTDLSIEQNRIIKRVVKDIEMRLAKWGKEKRIERRHTIQMNQSSYFHIRMDALFIT
jgi:hypothetical protein